MSAVALHAWGVHLLGSLALAAVAWGLGSVLQRWLHLSPAAPRYWLGVWLLAVLPPVVSLVLAVVTPTQIAVLPASLGLPVALTGEASATGPAGSAGMGWPSLAQVLLCVWLAGAVALLFRLMAGTLAAWRLVRGSTPLRSSDWPGPLCQAQAATLEKRGISIRLTSAAVTPFAVRWPHPTIAMPAQAFAHFSDPQLRLVLRHEAAHLQYRDPQRAGAVAVIGALLWFNPFLRRIAARMQLAAELRCDAVALEGDRASGRAFAGAYLTALRLSGHGAAPAALNALTHRDMAGHQLRIQHMLRGGREQDTPRSLRLLLAVGTLGLGTATAVVQAAALTPAALPRAATVSALERTVLPAATLPLAAGSMRFDAPLAQTRITSAYGDTGGIRQRAHRGTDFAARVGTPVLAPADGIVTAATTQYPEGPQYGTVVVLDHGHGWQSLFAHLDSTDLRVGQQVRRGETIARSGRTGKVTGPHLHMELLFNGERLDPLSRLP